MESQLLKSATLDFIAEKWNSKQADQEFSEQTVKLSV